MRRLTFCLLLLCGCGGESDAPAPPPAKRTKVASAPQATTPQPAPLSRAEEAEIEESGDAAAALRRYYERIGDRDYDAAWSMRSPGGDEAARQRFADNFKAYETYRATVGVPSRPVEAEGWLFVEVPVMIYGTFRGGKGFGTSGSVTLRRAADGRTATPAERRWHIYAR
jgi:hypothetical protein